ncbi:MULTISPECIES: ribosomal protein L7/L12 [unclassified Rhodococcus (in: high G+C Gram-positive bacteria)]|uniref:ribosomal protein L7/L12 n=1 Tax=unclassified Rhodococcus (in: high G+C Gram-positive bacteria) TaxID=192944 RepID=UPI001FFA2C54|nr:MULTISPECIES: ribosomal protein L7/L12 [unclassified Rhodococcus (in: high G+C Gram-positive bacteria)]
MPTWGWFIVALVLIDAAVLAVWLLARKNPRKNAAATTQLMLAGLDHSAREDIYRLVGEKKKIHAIKLFRERTGAGLQESKDVVESVGRGNPIPTLGASMGASGMDTAAWADIIPRLRTLKAEGNTISAIKLLRARSELSLREAKEAVDRL